MHEKTQSLWFTLHSNTSYIWFSNDKNISSILKIVPNFTREPLLLRTIENINPLSNVHDLQMFLLCGVATSARFVQHDMFTVVLNEIACEALICDAGISRHAWLIQLLNAVSG